MATTSSPTPAPAPFNSFDDADVILRSSDQYDFHAHKVVLGLASPFFKQMFSLSQPSIAPSSTATQPTNAESLPIVPVTEDRDTVDYLLRLCYPITDPTPPTDIGIVAKILEAAMKYELEEATDVTKKIFVGFNPTAPLKVFAHACRLRLEHEAKEAAKAWRSALGSNLDDTQCTTTSHTVDSPTVYSCRSRSCVFSSFQDTALGSTWVDEMKDISAGCLYRLLHFVRTGEMTTFCDPPSPPPVTDSSVPLDTDPGVSNLFSPNVVLRSSDMKLVPAHRAFLELAGAAGLFQGATPTNAGELPVVDMEADESTILNLLRICQPFAFDIVTQKTFTLANVHRLWGVADKYGMMKVMEAIKLSWSHHAEDAPLGLYFAALKCGWTTEARKAADYAMKFPLFDRGGYTPEMEFVSAQILRTLYQFQHDCRKSDLAVMEKYRSGSTALPQTTSPDPHKSTQYLPLILAPFIKSRHRSYCSNASYCCISNGRFRDHDFIRQTRSVLDELAATRSVILAI